MKGRLNGESCACIVNEWQTDRLEHMAWHEEDGLACGSVVIADSLLICKLN